MGTGVGRYSFGIFLVAMGSCSATGNSGGVSRYLAFSSHSVTIGSSGQPLGSHSIAVVSRSVDSRSYRECRRPFGTCSVATAVGRYSVAVDPHSASIQLLAIRQSFVRGQ